MYCTKCGLKVQGGDAFCVSCGAKIAAQQQNSGQRGAYSDNQAPKSLSLYDGQDLAAELKPGSVIEFGSYPQTMELGSSTQSTPISWVVLHIDTQTKEALLTSKDVLDCRKYHGKKRTVTWQDSEIRRWLNAEFFNRAFNTAEKQRIIKTLCAGNGAFSSDDLPRTTDYVFLLNSYEAAFFGADANRIAQGTEYAKAKKTDGTCLFTYGWDDKARWWLRNRGKGGSVCVAYVQDCGNIYEHGHDVDEKHYGVRPAIRVKLEPEMFSATSDG